MSNTKVTKKYTKLDNTKAKLTETEQGTIVSIVEEAPIFAFRNTLRGPFFFKREDGEPGIIEGGQVLDDITEKERKMLVRLSAFEDGSIVEETDVLPDGENYNRNALNEKQVVKLIDKHKQNDDFWRPHIDSMDSLLAINRLKAMFIERNFKNSLVAYCDLRISILEEEVSKEMEEPITEPPRGV